ncbi:hypothetical protein C8N46_102559 [Kordia periserrulae]|uniref:Uncharacterized protein n=1 Tax=Kordia periserrulae TaxID=701523 RepID=A0A2T6C4B0_9FLAO|nr:hypothetical protein [Kordia periserrulae]PTX63156.1 hypothetical protein C8N46_102559 [Kordia periserrulae]
MKRKVLYTVIASLIFFTACEESKAKNTVKNDEKTVEVTKNKAGEATAQNTVQESDGFKEVAPEKVPRTLLSALMKTYPDAYIQKISVNDDGVYRLDGSMESDGSKVRYYAKADGTWLVKDDKGNFVAKDNN